MQDELLAVLLGSGAAAALQRALGDSASLVEVQPLQVLHRPGGTTSVRYDAKLSFGGGPAAWEVLVARTVSPGDGGVEIAGRQVAAWVAPHDPALTAMAAACDPAFVRSALDRVGVGGGDVRLRLTAYRPCSRAVVEVEAGGTAFFLKVMRSPDAERIAAVHARLAEALPIARVHLVAPGVLLSEGLPGQTLARALRGGQAVPSAEDVFAVLDRLASLPPGERCAGRGASGRLARHADLLRTLLPEMAGRIDALAARFVPEDGHRAHTIHGDLHEGQILVEDGRVRGLLDLDDVGAGAQVADLAQLTGRVWVLGQERDDPRIRAYAESLLHQAALRCDLRELHRRVGIAVLGRVTAPFRHQFPDWRGRALRRLELAELWAAGMAAA